MKELTLAAFSLYSLNFSDSALREPSGHLRQAGSYKNFTELFALNRPKLSLDNAKKWTDDKIFK